MKTQKDIPAMSIIVRIMKKKTAKIKSEMKFSEITRKTKIVKAEL